MEMDRLSHQASEGHTGPLNNQLSRRPSTGMDSYKGGTWAERRPEANLSIV